MVHKTPVAVDSEWSFYLSADGDEGDLPLLLLAYGTQCQLPENVNTIGSSNGDSSSWHGQGWEWTSQLPEQLCAISRFHPTHCFAFEGCQALPWGLQSPRRLISGRIISQIEGSGWGGGGGKRKDLYQCWQGETQPSKTRHFLPLSPSQEFHEILQPGSIRENQEREFPVCSVIEQTGNFFTQLSLPLAYYSWQGWKFYKISSSWNFLL